MNRMLLWILTAFVFGWVHPAGAQQQTHTPRIGFIRPGFPPDPYADAFREGLRNLGYVEGQNIAIDYRWLEGKSAGLPSVAAELVQLNVDAIVTQGEAMTRPVKQVSSTIPIGLRSMLTRSSKAPNRPIFR